MSARGSGASDGAQTIANPIATSLADYRNADGRAPDGLASDADDTAALMAALAEGPGVVFVPAGSYRFGDVTVPAGVTLVGSGRGTEVRLARGANSVFRQNGVSDWRLRDMLLDGGAGAIHGGNVKVASSNFTNNLTGILIEDHENGSHGAISNCLINHNQQLALHARGIANGMTIDNCAFFGGGIRLASCNGVSITSSIIACDVRCAGVGANRIAGNHMIVHDEPFELGPSTMVEGNFTEKGPWELNRQA